MMAFLGRVRFLLAKGCSGHPKIIANQTASITSWDVKGSKYYKTLKVEDKVSVLKQEVQILRNRLDSMFNCDIRFDIKDGDYENIWKFHDRETIDKWIVTSDKDNNEGMSEANFQLSDNKTGVFHGFLNTEVVKDGYTKYAGYCNIKSFGSEINMNDYNFEPFNTLLLKVRGDGRNYLLSLGQGKKLDILNDNRYIYPLYTRGGPYWQTVMIPFSKFIASSKGRIQDKQYQLNVSSVSDIGITCQDGFDGPFHLEIHSIALLYDSKNIFEFDYETYDAESNAIGT